MRKYRPIGPDGNKEVSYIWVDHRDVKRNKSEDSNHESNKLYKGAKTCKSATGKKR